jgi:hypothetical protein
VTLPELAAQLTPICERFAHELAIDSVLFQYDHGTCPTCQESHAVASILGSLVHAIQQANEGQPELLLALAKRAGYLPAIQELVTP